MTPRLVYSLLGHRVYVVTRYRQDKHGVIVASQKHDVTEDFPRVMAEWKKEARRRKRALFAFDAPSSSRR